MIWLYALLARKETAACFDEVMEDLVVFRADVLVLAWAVSVEKT